MFRVAPIASVRQIQLVTCVDVVMLDIVPKYAGMFLLLRCECFAQPTVKQKEPDMHKSSVVQRMFPSKAHILCICLWSPGQYL